MTVFSDNFINGLAVLFSSNRLYFWPRAIFLPRSLAIPIVNRYLAGAFLSRGPTPKQQELGSLSYCFWFEF